MANKETSDSVSRLAAKTLRRMEAHSDSASALREAYNRLLGEAKTLAGSVLSQDETRGERYKPSAGTSAYEMVAAVEQRNVEVTETLIHMVAATVLHKLGKRQVGFSPLDMDEMHREWEMSATRDGLLTTIRLERMREGPLPPREAHIEDRPESLMRQDEPETPFEPQVEQHTHDRPLWAVRSAGKLLPASDRNAAERCNHIDTPEVTSGD